MKQGKPEQLHLLSCVQRSKNAISPVAMSCPSLLLHPVCCYKRPLREEEGLLPFEALLWAFGLFAWLWLFVLGGFLPLNIEKKTLLWAFWCRKLLEGKRIIEGKKIAKGKRIFEGKTLQGKRKIAEGKRIVEGKMLKRG
jgi:hypothetical protein